MPSIFYPKIVQILKRSWNEICRELNLLFNATNHVSIRGVSRKLRPKYRAWLKTSFTAFFFPILAWSEDILHKMTHTFFTWLIHVWASPISNYPFLLIWTLELSWVLHFHLIRLVGVGLSHFWLIYMGKFLLMSFNLQLGFY